MATVRYSPSPVQARSIRRRREIAEAGLRVFCANGYAAATMDEICERAGCSKGGLYHHFRGKEQVLEAVMELVREHAPLSNSVHQCASSWGVPESQLAQLLVEACAEATRSSRLALVMSESLMLDSCARLSDLGGMIQSVVLSKPVDEAAQRAA